MEVVSRTAMQEENVLVIVDTGLRVGSPLPDTATTLPFQRDELDTERVMRVAPIEDDAPAPRVPVALAAGIDLVAVDAAAAPAIARRTLARAPDRTLGATLATIAFLAGALGAGIGLAFLIAAIAM